MKKYSIIKAFTASLAAAALFCVTACNNDATEFVPTVAKGLEISSINLSASSVVLSGTSGITTKDLSADIYPSYATNTTVYWSSSDDSIVIVSSETGASVTLTLVGKGTAVVTARSESGVATASCKVICELETTAPDTVSGVVATANANNVYFQWTDPVDYDSDLDHIRIESNSGEYTEVAAGLEYGWVKGLSAGTEYNFTLTAIDRNGNASVGYSVTATTGDSVSEFTATEITAPEVSDKSASTFKLSWADDGVLDEPWNHMDVTVDGYSEFTKQIFYTADEIEILFEGLESNTEYTVNVVVYNDDFDELSWSDKITTDVYVATLVYNDDVTETVSGYLPLKLTDISEDITYSSIEFVIEGADNVTGTETSVEWTGLTLDQDYTVYARFLDSSDELVGVSTSIVKQPTKVIWHLLSGYSSGRYLARATSSSYTVGAIATGVGGDEYWIVHSALSGNSDYFSLEACGSDYIGSGYYMFLDTTGRAQDTGDNMWTSSVGYTNKLQVATLEESYITSGKKDASFKRGSSSVKTGDGWYRFYDENLGYYLVHASLAFGGVAASTTEDIAGCAAIYVEESLVK